MKKLIYLLLFLGIAAAGAGYWILLKNNIRPSESRLTVNIPTGTNMAGLLSFLEAKRILQSTETFELVAKMKNFQTVKPGHYVFNRAMSNREIVNMLQNGRQVPVKLTIYNIRTKEEFAGLLGRTLEIDSVAFLARLNDPAFCSKYGLDTNNILTRFIADGYEMKWNTDVDGFMSRMKESYDDFWDDGRRAKAKAQGYSPAQITTLASIVEKECVFDKELPTVAGVYENRLRINMPLQADPTLVWARRDFDTHRVTDYHKQYDTPYNTYMYHGLPPGPICIPRKKSIDAVLNPELHDYIYFCANPDMSGGSIFSKTLEEQNKVAVQYRKKLDQKKSK